MTAVNRRGVPVKGLLSCTAVGYGCVLLSALWPDTVFLFLINASGAVFLFVYLMISLSQLRMRKRLEAETPGGLQFKMWLHPLLPLVVVAAIAAVLVSMALDGSTRIELFQGITVWALLSVIHVARKRFGAREERPGSPGDSALVPRIAGDTEVLNVPRRR